MTCKLVEVTAEQAWSIEARKKMWRFSRTGPSGFSGRSTAEEVTQGIDGTGLTAIVTGRLKIFQFVV